MIEALTGICFVKPSNGIEWGDGVSVNKLADIQGSRANRYHGHVQRTRSWIWEDLGIVAGIRGRFCVVQSCP